MSEIKLNCGASPLWEKEGWVVLDHKGSRRTKNTIGNNVINIVTKSETCSMVFCGHTLEHIPNFDIEDVLDEFNRVIKIGGYLRIVIPDLKKITKAYVKKDKNFFKKLSQEDENIRTDLGFGGMLVNCVVSPGQDTILLNRDMTRFIGGYAHLYAYDFEMMKILLSNSGFSSIKQMDFCESSTEEMREPLHVKGEPAVWKNLNKQFYEKNGFIHKYKDGKYESNFTLTGFDRNPLSSLIIEAVKNKQVKKNKNKFYKNYNKYSRSLLCDSEVISKLKKLDIFID